MGFDVVSVEFVGVAQDGVRYEVAAYPTPGRRPGGAGVAWGREASERGPDR